MQKLLSKTFTWYVYQKTISVKKKSELTELGKYLILKSANKAEIYRKTGITESRLSLLSNDASTKLSGEELYLIALALDVEPGDMAKTIYKGVKLNTIAEQEALAAKSRKQKR
ncbi:Cro/C1-type HTH DNA-binding domain-containing protein [Pedobacter suwonensis]|uniref:Cro/C1-type HTH DNA-binding domain-containing protein n=1 Tax=Pedobacter suwonensis TaxID=332999 RepID=A0A1I0U1L7_9SPHI|nr:helix-turn-helix transcriptional regulator [Pedobacter suwonensis]SFA57793.1 Cro/C1-type HTH DNA-binding domain-containing protein [Pedobacter suwonensis]